MTKGLTGRGREGSRGARRPKQLDLKFTPDVAHQLIQRRPRPTPIAAIDQRWWYSWQAPTVEEFERLTAEDKAVAQ